MKLKLLMALSLSACLGCDPDRMGSNVAQNGPVCEEYSMRRVYEDFNMSIHEFSWEGHKYLIYKSYRAGNMIHSESCPCKELHGTTREIR